MVQIENKIVIFPPTGTAGKQVKILANYFPVKLSHDQKIFQYHVDFKPPIENIRVKFAIIARNMEAIGAKVLFDGGILYLSRLLPSDVSIYFIL